MPLTLLKPFSYEGPPIKGSRFLVRLGPIADEDAARTLLAEQRKMRPDASHHCSAWRLLSPVIDRASDDGEPGGSAGRPMLNQLTGRDVVNVAAVVTRYFGGTKLGVGGLVRAYGGAVGEALDHCRLVEHVAMTAFEIGYGHSADRAAEDLINDLGGSTASVRYETEVSRTVAIPEDHVDRFIAGLGDLSAGQATIRELPAG